MSPRLTSKSAIAVGGASAIAIGALSMALVMGPASADNVSGAPSDSSAAQQFGDMDHQGHGRHGRHGGPEGRGGHGPRSQAVAGTVIQREDTFKATDGTVTVVRHQFGTVTAVSATAITVKTGSVSNDYVVNADTAGDVSTVVVDDQVGIESVVADGVATALHVHAAPAMGDLPGGPMHGGPDGDGPRGHGPMGDGPRGHGPMGDGPHGDEAAFGERVLEEELIETADGSLVTVREYKATVVSVSGSSITVTTVAGDTKTFEVPTSVTVERNRAEATLADFVAGDEVHVEVTVDGSAETVVGLHGHSEDVQPAVDAAGASA